MASFAMCAPAMYSAPVLERATDGCFLELQLITPAASMKMNPDVDLCIHIAGPVSINVTMEMGAIFGSSLKDKVLIARGSEVAEHAVKSLQVLFTGISSMASKCSHSVGEIGAGPQHWIHQHANRALVQLYVSFG